MTGFVDHRKGAHQDRTELHGITVVVDTAGPLVYVGRCHDITDDGVELRNADAHSEGEGTASKEEFVKKASLYGVWSRIDRLVVPADQVASVTRLAEVE